MGQGPPGRGLGKFTGARFLMRKPSFLALSSSSDCVRKSLWCLRVLNAPPALADQTYTRAGLQTPSSRSWLQCNDIILFSFLGYIYRYTYYLTLGSDTVSPFRVVIPFSFSKAVKPSRNI